MPLTKSLYIISIPIGNIYDFTQRAIFILKNVDMLIVEDTKKSSLLLKKLRIKKKIISLNIYNEIIISKKIINLIKNKKSAAYISDSGTPLINDPGYYLIKTAYKNLIKIIPIPGSSSITTLLSITLFDNKFIFNGFLPKKTQQKINEIKKYIKIKKNIIFFETSHRLLKSLMIIKNIISPKIKILIAKDLTKTFESIVYIENITNNKLLHFYNNLYNGEFVIMLNFKKEKKQYIFINHTKEIIINKNYFFKFLL